MYCANCGQHNDDRATFCQACGNALQATAAPTGAGVAYAGFWQRFVAILIDWVVLGVGSGVVYVATFGTVFIAYFILAWIYEAFMLSSEWQATLGKRALSIVVTGMDGGRISFWRATARHFAKYISGFILLIGYIMAAFTARKQALHDMIAETLVVNR